MFRRFLVSLSGLLLVGWFAACSDHLNPAVTPGSTASRLRVKTITLDLPDNQAKVSLLKYDAQGRLSTLTTYQTPDSTVAPVELGTYQYDSQNRLTQFRNEIIRRLPPFESNLLALYTYTYNPAGQVSGLQLADSYGLTFAYTDANKLLRDNRSYITGGLTTSGGDNFTFTGNNLTTWASSKTTNVKQTTFTSSATSTYTYDDKLNPFYGVYIIPAPYPIGRVVSPRTTPDAMTYTYFGGVDNGLNLSQNNPLSCQTNNGSANTTTVAYAYEYNSANLPTVRRTTTNGTLTETIRFTYESY